MTLNNNLILTVFFHALLSSSSFIAQAQNPDVYKKISQIEAYDKYEIMVVDKLSLKQLSDSSNTFLELISYLRNSKKNYSGKTEEKLKNETGEYFRTYYFDEEGKIFVLIERIQSPGKPLKKFTYFYETGDLKLVVDENNVDVTSTIDREKHFHWLRRMFDVYTLK
ncbi:MAG: hypothetical protein HOP30_08245 [Cyclobacteriaceae bacterium]|nr:hypothetical protein [Cyclobacteriaceae bacterium]